MDPKTSQTVDSNARAAIPEKKFGTFTGVFIPSVLTVFGVIMYLRMGFVVGNVGLAQTLLIVTMSSVITLLTALSISATATNMNVRGGGAYFMISRSLGLEAGAAVGIPLYLAQTLGISFYLAGFAESVLSIYDGIPAWLIAVAALLFLFGLAFQSADIALKSQYVILAVILVSLASFFAGSPPDAEILNELRVSQTRPESFWVVFAVFFPAVTGILAGVSMSGDLKSPAKSLPLGTIMAVLTGFLVYMGIPIFLTLNVGDDAALRSPLIFQKVAAYEPLIFLGIWGATLSSALGGLLAGPRTLQALARDGVFSRHLRAIGKGSGANDTPRIATLVTVAIAFVGVVLGDLNAIASVLTMFFLTAYGVLNFSAGIEGVIANPAWRPKFRTPWSLSLIGSLFCFATMVMIDAGSTIVALAVSFAVYTYMQRKNLKTNFGDLRRGILMFLARYSIFRLAELPPNAKSWRPHVLVFSGSPSARWYLVELAHAITHGKGFMTVSTIVPKGSSAENRLPELRQSITDYLRKRAIQSLVNVSVAENVNDGALALVRTYGIGSLTPNTILLGETEEEENFRGFVEMIIRIYQVKRNIVIVREGNLQKRMNGSYRKIDKKIDVWWGREQENAGLSLTLGYMLQNSPEWAGADLYLKSITTNPNERQAALHSLTDFLKRSRVEAAADVFVTEKDRKKIFAKIHDVSRESDLIFMGMEPPKIDKFVADRGKYLDEYAEYYRALLARTAGFPPTAMVISAQEIKYAEIFS